MQHYLDATLSVLIDADKCPLTQLLRSSCKSLLLLSNFSDTAKSDPIGFAKKVIKLLLPYYKLIQTNRCFCFVLFIKVRPSLSLAGCMLN